MRGIEAIIFDMDGVIVDSEPLHERAFVEVFEAMGYGETHGIHFPDYYGRSDLALWEDFVERHRPAQSLEHLYDWKQRHFIEMLRREQPLFAGLPELIERLAPRFKLGLASGSFHPVINEVLALRELRRFFGAVVSAEDVAAGKPAPDIFLRAAQLLGTEPARCCVIEDSAAGVRAALAAGMPVLAITNSLPAEKLAEATLVVRGYDEIERFLTGPL